MLYSNCINIKEGIRIIIRDAQIDVRCGYQSCRKLISVLTPPFLSNGSQMLQWYMLQVSRNLRDNPGFSSFVPGPRRPSNLSIARLDLRKTVVLTCYSANLAHYGFNNNQSGTQLSFCKLLTGRHENIMQHIFFWNDRLDLRIVCLLA